MMWASMEAWAKANIILFTALVAIIPAALGVVITLWAQRRGRPRLEVSVEADSSQAEVVARKRFKSQKLLWRNVEVANLWSYVLSVSNSGTESIRWGTHVDPKVGLRSRVPQGCTVLGAWKKDQADPGVRARARKVSDTEVSVTFETLNPGEWFRIRVVGTGPVPLIPGIVGRLVGAALRHRRPVGRERVWLSWAVAALGCISWATTVAVCMMLVLYRGPSGEQLEIAYFGPKSSWILPTFYPCAWIGVCSLVVAGVLVSATAAWNAVRHRLQPRRPSSLA